MQDSGWYEVNLNFHDRLFWGKNKGCDFFNLKCNASPRPQEFCDKTDDQSPPIDYYFTGQSFCGTDDFFDDNCYYFKPYDNTICANLENNTSEKSKDFVQAGSVYGWESKGVSSNLQPEGKQLFSKTSIVQCYPSRCVEKDGKKSIEFYVGEKQLKLVCQSDKQVLKLGGYSGSLTCPIIADFCERQYGCENYCNQGGFCMNQKCYCNPGFTGPNCECGNGVFYKNKTQSCTNCLIPNCYSCDTKLQCTKCDDNYILNASGQCVVEIQVNIEKSSGTILLYQFIIIFILSLL